MAIGKSIKNRLSRILLIKSFYFLVMLMLAGGCSRRAETPPETTYSPELRLRAEQGDLRAQHQLGLVLMKGAGVPENAEEGARWMGKASLKNYAPSQFFYGIMLRVSGSRELGLEMIERAAEQGLPEAQMFLGMTYLEGDGVPKDIPQAINWFQKAGEGGIGDAFTNLGYIYWDGNGVPQDRKLGASYWKKAAKMGFLHGQNDYAWFLATSPEAGDRDGREAVRWAERAVRLRRDCTTLDTLAAAYAEDGQFEKAVETQKEAIQKLKNLDEETRQEWAQLPTIQEAEMRLRLYQEGMPFREQ